MEISQSVLLYVKENLSDICIRETNSLLNYDGDMFSCLRYKEKHYLSCMYVVPKVAIGTLEPDEFQLYTIFQVCILQKKAKEDHRSFKSTVSIHASKWEIEDKKVIYEEITMDIKKLEKDIKKIWEHLHDIIYERLKDTSIKEAYIKEPKLFKNRYSIFEGWFFEINFKKEIFITNYIPFSGGY